MDRELMRAPRLIQARLAGSRRLTSLPIIAALAIAALSGVGSSRAETRSAYGGTVQAALPAAPTTLDPLHGGPADAELAQLLFDAPFKLVDGKPRPQLAIALELGDARARLILRSDVRFSDGSPLTARDVAASLTRALADPGGWMLAPIKSARAVADDVVELELLRPTPELALLLATPAAMITPGGQAPGKRIGSGPFLVEAWDGSGARLAPNPSCFAGRPYLASLSLRAFSSRADETGSFELGALHASRHGSVGFDNGGARRPVAVVEGAPAITGFIAVGRGPDAELFRRALALAINRERLRRLTVREPAVVATGATPPALGGPTGKASYDPARAKTMIEARFNATRPHLSLLIDNSRFDDHDVAERILADLARVGIDVVIEGADAAQYQARLDAGRYELVLGAARPPAPDGTLAALAVLAAVDPAAARAAFARAAAPAVDVEATRVVPLFHRAARVYAAPELRGLRVDAAGRVDWADAHWLQR
jgi:ABC-type transport system substrate-binding protein